MTLRLSSWQRRGRKTRFRRTGSTTKGKLRCCASRSEARMHKDCARAKRKDHSRSLTGQRMQLTGRTCPTMTTTTLLVCRSHPKTSPSRLEWPNTSRRVKLTSTKLWEATTTTSSSSSSRCSSSISAEERPARIRSPEDMHYF
jgi:hypothetical protein